MENEQVIVDVRKGKPSASKMKRYSLCPGSHKRADWMPEKPNKDATSGTRVHGAHETGDDSNLEQDEQTTFERGRDQEGFILSNYVTRWGKPTWVKREHRFWCKDLAEKNGKTFRLEFSGQADVVAYWEDYGALLVGDHKTGWVGADDAIDNDQIKALIYAAVVEMDQSGSDVIQAVAVMIQPNVKDGLSVQEFNSEEIGQACWNIAAILSQVQEPSPSIRPGVEQCKYCPALTMCPEANKVREGLLVKAETSMVESPEMLAAVLDAGDLVDKIHKANREKAKELIVDEGWKIPGWEVQETKGRSTIDASGALSSLKQFGVSEGALWAAVSITKTAIKKVLRITKNVRGQELDQLTESLIKDHTTEGAPVKKLVRSRK